MVLQSSQHDSTAGAASQPFYDADNVTQCEAFTQARRKLRLVFAEVDVAAAARTVRYARHLSASALAIDLRCAHTFARSHALTVV